MKIYLKDPRGIRGNLHVGNLEKKNGKILFKKNVDKSKHYMRIVKGYGIDKTVFDKFIRGSKGRIMLRENDKGKITYLVASIKTWTDHSSNQNFGDGKQVFLSRKYMHNAENFNRNDIVKTEPIAFNVKKQLSQVWKKTLKEKANHV